MAARDYIRQNDGTGHANTFIHGMSRKQQLLLQKELDDVNRRTQAQWVRQQESDMNVPLTDSQRLTKQLLPNFKHVRELQKRKRHPIFHEDLMEANTPRLKSPHKAVPDYNPLDRLGREIQLNVDQKKTKKYPFSKDRSLTIEQMQQARVSSVGVTPTRNSNDIDDLKVLLEGKPVIQSDVDPILGLVQRANTIVEEDILEPAFDTDDLIRTTDPYDPRHRPAIMASVGTLCPAPRTERSQPSPKPITRLKKIQLPRLESGERKIEPEVRSARYSSAKSSRSSVPTIKSVKELLDEAKILAKPTAREQKYMNRVRKESEEAKKEAKKLGMKAKSKLRLKSISSVSLREEPVLKERTVDEIIASLKDEGTASISEVDRKINVIISRVLSRTAAVLGNVDESAFMVEKEEQEVKKEKKVVAKSPEVSRSVTPVLVIDEAEKVQMYEPEFPSDQYKDIDEISVISDTTSVLTSEPPPVIQEALEELAHAASTAEETQELRLDLTHLDEVEQGGMNSAELRQAWKDLNAPEVVTYDSLLRIDIGPAPTYGPTPPPPPAEQPAGDVTARDDVTRGGDKNLLSSWVSGAPSNTAGIHHFCSHQVLLPDPYRGVWKRYHVPDKLNFLRSSKKPQPDSPGPLEATHIESDAHLSTEDTNLTMVDRRESQTQMHAADARHIVDEANELTSSSSREPDTIETWARRAQQVFDVSNMTVEGKKLDLKSSEQLVYWTMAPPKWDVTPNAVRQNLFPLYHGVHVRPVVDSTMVKEEEEQEEEAEVEAETVDTLDPIDAMARDRVLSRRCKSIPDLASVDEETGSHSITKPVQASESALTVTKSTASSSKMSTTLETPGVTAARNMMQSISIVEMQAQMSALMRPSVLPDLLEVAKPDTPKFPVPVTRRRTKSGPPRLVNENDDYILVFEDYNVIMKEMEEQRQQLRDIKAGIREPPVDKSKETTEPEPPAIAIDSVEEALVEQPGISPRGTSPGQIFKFTTKSKPTIAEEALAAGRSYVILPPKKKKCSRVKKLAATFIESLEYFLAEQPKKLSRSNSLPKLTRKIEYELRVPMRVRTTRRPSIPSSFGFQAYEKSKGYKEETFENMREFYRSIWNIWFDQVFPPTPDGSGLVKQMESSDSESEEEEEEEPPAQSARSSSFLTVFSENALVDPIIEDKEDQMSVEMIETEVAALTEEITSSTKPRAFDYARRGAMQRKLGRCQDALTDLSKAIQMEPTLLNAYWHRHIIYLLLNKHSKALDDLNMVIKHNKNYPGAYRSRAAIYQQTNDMTMAIVNFSQAIKQNPKDYEAYFQRAEMFEKSGDILLAMEDYAMATRLMPSKTEALFRHGHHYFKNSSWMACINDFTELLKVEPNNSKARLMRARAYAKLKSWGPAIQDFSATIHLDPQNYRAFYYRGCILRKTHPKRAVQDLSVSLLINNYIDNVLAYLHRGILYTEIERYEEAILDFEAVLKLDKDIPLVHVNLGLVYMMHHENYLHAIKKFSAALRVDPTYVRAYMCRAEAYSRLNDFKNALLDFTRAIHLKPDVGHYYMYRGYMVLKSGNLELAAFCVRHAAGLNAGLGQSPTQQAIVQSFLKNYDKAIQALLSATRVTPSPEMFILLGKTQMKARLWKDAINSFKEALKLVTPWEMEQSLPREAAEMFYLIGLCNVEIPNFLAAHEALNSSIHVNSKFAEAFYQRGIVRMKLKQHHCIQDFNRALAVNPHLFQAYLSRAAYYGLKKRYTKGILNCNEAIKMQPNSVRAYLYRGSLKFFIRAYGLAIHDLTQATKIDSLCELAYFNRAICYHKSGNWQKSLQDYSIVLLLGNRLLLKVLVNRGLLYFEHKDYINALCDFLLAVKANNYDKRLHHTVGICYHKLWKLEDAVRSFSHALSLDQFFIDGYIGRGNTFLDFGHAIGHNYAKRDYQRALRLNPLCIEARVNLGYSLQMAGHHHLAWHQFSAIIANFPNCRPALEGRAIINLQMSNTFGAFQDINTSVVLQPTAELLTNRGVIYQFMNDLVNAQRDYQEALKHDPTYSLAYFNAGNVYFHHRQFNQALAYYSQAITYNPKDESALLNRAITKVLLRDTQGAMLDFGKAIKLSPLTAHVYFNRGNLFASLKKWEKAEADYSKALSLQPGDALVLNRRAEVYGKLGDKEQAIEDYRQAIRLQTAKIHVSPPRGKKSQSNTKPLMTALHNM